MQDRKRAQRELELAREAAAKDPGHDTRGKTAEDGSGVAEGEEGFVAEEYPGHNPLQGETRAEYQARVLHGVRGPGDEDVERQSVRDDLDAREERGEAAEGTA